MDGDERRSDRGMMLVVQRFGAEIAVLAEGAR
jgi:hypothetical protein